MEIPARIPRASPRDSGDRPAAIARTAGGRRRGPPSAGVGAILAIALLGLLLLPGPSYSGATTATATVSIPHAPGASVVATGAASGPAGGTPAAPSPPTLPGWQWTNLTAGISITPCVFQNGCYAAWDPALDGIVVLSFLSGVASMELYQNGSYRAIHATTLPAPAYLGGLAYDAADGYLVLFGGYNQAGYYANQTWTFSGTTWTQLSPATSPPPMASFGMAYDPSLSEVVVVEGSSGGSPINTTWLFRAGTWTPGPALPSAGLYNMAVAYDAAASALIAVGGANSVGQGTNATWKLTATGWSPVALASGSELPGGTYLLAPSPAGPGLVAYSSVVAAVGTWLYGNGSWTNVTAPVGPSAAETESVLATDPTDNTTLLVGGNILNPSGPGPVEYPVTWVLHAALDLGGRTDPPGATVASGRPVDLIALATGGIGGYRYTWSNAAAGCAPATGPGGLPLPQELLCTESTVGNYSATATVVDPADPPARTTLTFSVVPGPVVGLPAASRAGADVGQVVSFSVPIAGGVAPWTVAWTGLPAGCSGNSGPLVVCAPTAAGSSSIAATVTDASGAVAVGAALPFVVAPDPVVGAPVFGSPGPVAATDVGRWANVSVSLPGTGAGGPYTYAWSGLPAGCPGTDAATVACRPAAPGVAAVTVAVTDANGFSATSPAAALVVNGNLSVLAERTGGNASVGAPTYWTAAIAGGTAPFAESWYVGPTEVGAGPSLTYAFGAAGTATVTLVVTDSAGSTAVSNHTVTVLASPPTPKSPTVTGSTSGLTSWEMAALVAAVVLGIAALGVSGVVLLRRPRTSAAAAAPPAATEPPKGPT